MACAIFAPLASADYMRIEFISASSTCDGNPTSITSNVIGCETDSDGESRCVAFDSISRTILVWFVSPSSIKLSSYSFDSLHTSTHKSGSCIGLTPCIVIHNCYLQSKFPL